MTSCEKKEFPDKAAAIDSNYVDWNQSFNM